ncbi:MAG TPA: CvpA family protein [bacterium]|nr:CvpA family protein [bacterium]
MNWVDWIILAVVAVSTFAGLMRGALKTVLSLVGLVVGFVAATRESGAVGMVLARWMPEPVAAAVGFVFVFLGVALVFTLLAWLLRKLLQGLALGWLDRLGGAALGLARGAAIVGVLALVVEGLGGFDTARASVAYGSALQVGQVLLRFVPEDTRERLDWDHLRGWIPDKSDLPVEIEEAI